MSREVLAGRVGLREAVRIPAYAEALGQRVAAARSSDEELSEEEREQQAAEARAYLDAQQSEIDEEQHRADGGDTGR